MKKGLEENTIKLKKKQTIEAYCGSACQLGFSEGKHYCILFSSTNGSLFPFIPFTMKETKTVFEKTWRFFKICI